MARPATWNSLGAAVRLTVSARLLLQGGKEYLMRAHFGLPSVEAEDKEGKPPISVKFEIPYFTTSGIQVRMAGVARAPEQTWPGPAVRPGSESCR